MKNLIFFFIFCSIYSLVPAQSKLDFEFDFAQFGYNKDSNYLEIVYTYNQADLKRVGTDKKQINAVLHIYIQDTSKTNPIVNSEYKINQIVTDSVDKSLVGTLSYILPRGFYSVTVSGQDANDNEKVRQINDKIRVVPVIKNNATISDIQLASNIIPESNNTKSIFYKNSYEVYPAPKGIFGNNWPLVYYYVEFYGLNYIPKTSTLKMETKVYNQKNQLISNKSKFISHDKETQVQVGTIPITKYPSGTYVIVMSLIDSANNYGVTSSKRFLVYNPDILDTIKYEQKVSSVVTSEFGSMSEEELDDIYAKSKYLANTAESKQYPKLSSVEAKREFLYKFWQGRDEDKSTSENETFKKYLMNVELANSRYSSAQKPGWRTDRGRVFLMYGEPSEVDRYPNQSETKPYEIWHYNDVQGGVEFVFADITGFSEYILIHSTMRGELQDANWQDRINAN